MGRTNARGLGKGPVPVRGSEPTGLWVPARAVLALLLALVAELLRVCSHMGGTDRRLSKRQVQEAGLAVRVLVAAAARHVDLVLMAGTDEQGFGGPGNRSRKYIQ